MAGFVQMVPDHATVKMLYSSDVVPHDIRRAGSGYIIVPGFQSNFVLHELYEFDRVQLLLFFAILALYDAVYAVRYMEVCGHRLVVGNALWISTFNDSDNFLWQGDTFLFNNLVVAYNT